MTEVILALITNRLANLSAFQYEEPHNLTAKEWDSEREYARSGRPRLAHIE
jgi:hypothetical protein